MINKISVVSQKPNFNSINTSRKPFFNKIENINKNNLIGAKYLPVFQSMGNISFGNKHKPNNSFPYVRNNQIQIPDLANIDSAIHLHRKDMPKGFEKLNAAGLNVDIENDDNLNF